MSLIQFVVTLTLDNRSKPLSERKPAFFRSQKDEKKIVLVTVAFWKFRNREQFNILLLCYPSE